MEYIVSQKIELDIDLQTQRVLENQSRMLARMYNTLLDMVKNDKDTNYSHKYNLGNNLRNEVPKIKKENPYYYQVHASPLKNAAIRLKKALVDFLEGRFDFPKYFDSNNKFFSLLYEDPGAGIKFDGKNVRISLGMAYDEFGKKHYHYIYGKLKQNIIKNKGIRTCRIIKQYGKFYIALVLKVDYSYEYPKTHKNIAIDPNISNFMVSVDSDGNMFQLQTLDIISYLDKEIDKVKSLRDKCDSKAKVYTKVYTDKLFYQPSNKWTKRNDIIHELYRKRNVQVSQALYHIANLLTDHYDTIAIGNYAAKLSQVTNKSMNRKMLQQTCITRFRRILQHVCDKKGKSLIILDEGYTTSDCFNCGLREFKSPDVREFHCDNCGLDINRDVNSAINIGLKAGIFKKDIFLNKDLCYPDIYEYKIHKQKVVKIF